METIISISEISNNITQLMIPLFAVLFSVIVSLWIKDFATRIAKGLSFKLNSNFQEGDKVIIDNEPALIVKIGMLQTVFGITKKGGDFDGDYCWRYVPNERIPFLKLEKIIFDNTAEQNKKLLQEKNKKHNKEDSHE